MAAVARAPRLLAEFHFNDAGTVYVSDQALGAADGLSNEHSALVEDWGDLVGAGGLTDNDASEIRQMTVTLWNGGTTPFSDYFLSEEPENVEVDVYQWFTGLTDSDKALIDRFVIQDPISTDEASRLLVLDLVTLSMKYDDPIGSILKLNDWPDAKESDVGKYIPLVLGDPYKYIPTLCAKTAAKATLNGSILTDTTTVNVYEDLGDEGFASSGTIQIDMERMTYSSRTSSAFTITQRGADDTTAAEHLDQAGIAEHITDFTYLIGDHAISAVNGVKVGGMVAPSSIYTAYPALSPSRIVFSEKPYAKTFASGSTFLEMQFDAHDEDETTALQPYLAYDASALQSAAQMNETYSKLVLQQKTVNPDRGQIVKAYLAVEHWESGAAIVNDRVKVTITGLGDQGYLTRPGDTTSVSLTADVDIDHGHTHSISGEHTHVFTDPHYASDEDPHTHGGGTSTTVRKHASAQVNIRGNGEIKSVTIPNCPTSWSGATLHFEHYSGFPSLSFSYSGKGRWVQGSYNTTVQINPTKVETITVSFTLEDGGWLGLITVVHDIYIDFLTEGAIETAYTGVGIAKQTDGTQDPESDKASDDVTDLSTGNRSVSFTDTDISSRTVTNLFDITSLVNYSWSWFTDIEAVLEYEGTADNEDVYILHVFFDIEYRKEDRIFSDDVTVDVTGLIDDADGTYTGTASAAVKRPDHVRKYLLQGIAGLGSDRIDAPSFDAAGNRYNTLGYEFNGVLKGEYTVRQAEHRLARQCRSRWFWDAGEAFMKLKEMHADWTIDKTLTQTGSDLRLKGMAYQRKDVKDILNRVSIHYNRRWNKTDEGVGGFESVEIEQDNERIALHGIRENTGKFLFDMVISQTMAADLADFYVEDGKASQFYFIDAFLPFLDLQKEDHFQLTHDFMSLSKAAMRIADVERVFGSGKLKRMNMLRIIAESWYRLISVAKGDSVAIGDILNIEWLFADHFTTTVRATDLLNYGFNPSDTVTVAEALAIVMTWVATETETVTASESLVAAMGVAASDSVTVEEAHFDLDVGAGFGMEAFGEGYFGSLFDLDDAKYAYVAVAEALGIFENAVLSDTVTCTDSPLFSSGFGSPWAESDGFGVEPFGY